MLIFLAWLTSGILFAQPAPYKFSRINLDQGLSHNQINAIFKDSRGYMWFGTTSGLNRYDGYSFKSFRHDARDTASLSNNYVEAIFEGPEGKLWVRTRGGLNVYDPRTGRFHQDPSPFLRQLSLPNLAVTDILRDRKGDYWFLDPNRGLFRYSASVKKAEKVPHRPTDSLTVRSPHLSALAEDPQGDIWVIHRNGLLEKLNSATLQVTYRSSAISRKYPGEELDYRLFIDREGSLWVLPGADARGLLYFDPAQNHLLHIHQDAQKSRINNNLVRAVVQDDRGLIWIATDHGGINLLDKEDFSVQYLLHHPDDEKSLSQNSIYSLYKDNTGIVWVGTFKKGISYFHENIIKFPLVKNQAANPNSLPYDDINRFVEDAKGNLWIGTNGGGLLYLDRASGRYTQFLHDPNNPNSVSSNVIVSLHLDHAQKLWIGTYFGGLSVYDGSTFTHYKHDPADPQSLADNRVWALFEDSQKTLWVGTLAGGLDRFDREKNIFHHYPAHTPNSLHTNYVSAITEDREGNLWVGTGFGIEVLDRKTGRFTHYVNAGANPSGLSNNDITYLLEDSKGFMWVGTNDGLSIFDKRTRTFQVFREEDGLPSNTVRTILEDDHHTFWLGTTNGLSNAMATINPQTGKYELSIKNYDKSDGLQGKVFNEFAAYKTRRGELLFAGANGFNLFKPTAISVNKHTPELRVCDLCVFQLCALA